MKKSRILVFAFALLAMTSTQYAQEGTSILGTPTRLMLSSADVITSITWWTRMGFLPVPQSKGRLDSIVTMTDGQLVITITKQSLPTPIIIYQTKNIKRVKDTLEALGIAVTYDVKGPSLGEVRLVSPNGIHIAVRPESDEPLIAVSGDSNRQCGKNTELSIGTGYLKREKTFWEKLEFGVKREGNAPYAFALMTDGVYTIGMHENRDIPSLAITYFAQNMSDRLQNIRNAGIEMSDEELSPEGRVGSAVLTSPEGQKVMLFQGAQ